LRRIIIACTAVAVLVGASVAVAATLNTYTAAIKFSPSKAGSKKKPVPVGFTETYTAANDVPGSRAAPLTDIKTTIYGLVSNAKHFPTCDGTQISIKKSDSFCPKKALVASGPVNSLLGGTDLSQPGAACNPFLHVWNGGKGKLWFFFTTDATHQCGTLHTGDTNAYPGFVKQVGKNQVTDVPLPPFVSTAVAGHSSLYGSLIKQVVTFKKLTTKVKGKTVGFNSSVACKGGKRPYSVAFTATSTAGSETKVVKGSAKC
jgi:hypothetical protein